MSTVWKDLKPLLPPPSVHNLQSIINMGKIKAAAAGVGAYEVGKHAHHHHEKHEAKKEAKHHH